MIYENAVRMVTTLPQGERHLEYIKERHSAQLGVAIGKNVGFDKIENRENDEDDLYVLKVAAFKYSEWLRFRNALKAYLDLPNRTATSDLIMIGKMVQELETK